MTGFPASVKMKEVGLRDGLQAESRLLPTGDLVHMLHEMGLETGVNLEALIGCARFLEGVLGHGLPGRVMKAGICGHLTAGGS